MVIRKKKRSCFKKKQKKYIARIMPKLQRLAKIKSAKEMKTLLNQLDKREMNFVSECAYNVIFNAEKVLTRDQVAFIQRVLKKCKKKKFQCLYKFVFQGLTSKSKIRCLCQSYDLISIILSMLIPIFKILVEK